MSEILSKESMLVHRKVLGILGMLLPVLSIIGGLLVNNGEPSWWYSISVTYYITPALSVVLGSCSLYLLCYRSYETIDTVVNTISGILGFLIVLFPCSNPYGIEHVGYFQVPVNISEVIHMIAAIAFFISLIFNILFLFTKGSHKGRNITYIVCGSIMTLTLTLYLILSLCKVLPNGSLMVTEAILLLCFGIAWLVKGKALTFRSKKSINTKL